MSRRSTLARQVGDKQQEANLLWFQGIQLAELGQRDAAIARAQDAIALFTKLGKPQASWYGAYLQKYRMGLYDTWPAPAAAGVAAGPQAYLGGSLVAGVMAGPPSRRNDDAHIHQRPRPAPHGPVRHQVHGEVRRLGVQDHPARSPAPAAPGLFHLRAPYRHPLQGLRLLHHRQEQAPPGVLPHRQVAGLIAGRRESLRADRSGCREV